jgi:hypothetical protein
VNSVSLAALTTLTHLVEAAPANTTHHVTVRQEPHFGRHHYLDYQGKEINKDHFYELLAAGAISWHIHAPTLQYHVTKYGQALYTRTNF